MCDLTSAEMRKCIPEMLSGIALGYYISHLKHLRTYDEVITGLKSWFTSEEQRSRLLQVWQGMRLSAELAKNPEKSEMEVFRTMSAELSKIQRQLHPDYHGDRFMKDRLVTSDDLPQVARSLKKKPPVAAQKASQRIAALLSSHLRVDGENNRDIENSEAYYGLGRRFMGSAERSVKGFGSGHQKGSSFSGRRKLPKVKGCWVCGKSHRARDFHEKSDIDTAIQKLKSNGAYVTISDALEVFVAETIDESSDDEEYELSDNEEPQAFALEQVHEINLSIVSCLNDNTFKHSYGFVSKVSSELNQSADVSGAIGTEPFRGILIDPGANYMSIMSLDQYRSYCSEYGQPGLIRNYNSKTISGVGGRQTCYGSVIIPVPFYDIDVIADITFHLTKSKMPTLLCLRDLKETGFQLDIQQNCLRFMGQVQPLHFQNGLLWHK